MLKGLKESENQNHNIIVTNEYKEEINYKTPYEQTIEFKKIKEYLRGQNKLVYVTDTIKRLFKINVVNNLNYFKVISKENSIGYGGKRVIIYLRLSVEDLAKEDGNVSKSIVNQLLLLLQYCQKYELEIVAIFYEEDLSGSDECREEWNKSLAFCEYGHTDVYLCKAQARFARSMEFVEKYLHKKFIEWSVRFISLVDGVDTDNKSSKKTSQITAMSDEWKLEEQSINTRKTLQGKNRAGQWTAAFAPFGYKKDPADKYHLIIDEPAAKTVRIIYDMYANGKSYNQICIYLNENKIPTPSRYRKLQKSNYYCRFSPNGSEFWCVQSVKKILMDEVYDGILIQHRTEKLAYNIKKTRKVPRAEQIIVACTHEPIIKPEISKIVRAKFSAKKKKLELDNAKKEARNLIVIVESALNEYKKIAKDKQLEIASLIETLKDSYLSEDAKTITSNYNKLRNCVMSANNGLNKKIMEKTDALRIEKTRARACKDGKIHIFSQKVVCQCCGRTFAKRHYNYKGKENCSEKDYLYCKTKKSSHGYTCENNRSIKFNELYEVVLNELNNQIDKYYDLKTLKENYCEKEMYSDLKRDIESLKSEKQKLEQKIKSNNEKFVILYEDKASSVISADEFMFLKQKYKNDNDNYNIRIKKIEAEIIDLQDKFDRKKTEVNIFEKYKHLDQLDKITVDTFISKIVIGKVDEKTHQRDIKIIWNYAI